MNVPPNSTCSHITRCVGPSHSGKSSVARRLSCSTWPVDVTAPAIVPIARHYHGYSYDWYNQYICYNYLGHSFSHLFSYNTDSNKCNTSSNGNLNVNFTIHDPYNESQTRTKFQTIIANNYDFMRNNGAATTTYTSGYWGRTYGTHAHRHRYQMNRQYNYNNRNGTNYNIGYENYQKRHKLETYKPDKYNDFQNFETLNSCLIIIDAKKIINSYLRYQIEFDNAWVFIQDYLNDIFNISWNKNNHVRKFGLQTQKNRKGRSGRLYSGFYSKLQSKMDNISREMKVIICLNKCDEKNMTSSIATSELEFECKQYDCDNDSDNDSDSNMSIEEMCQEYDELKNMFEDKINEWKKNKIVQWIHSANVINIETMIISAKSGYNLDCLLNKLAKMEHTKRTSCENLISTHLNHDSNEKRVVLWNYFCCVVMILGLLVYLLPY